MSVSSERNLTLMSVATDALEPRKSASQPAFKEEIKGPQQDAAGLGHDVYVEKGEQWGFSCFASQTHKTPIPRMATTVALACAVISTCQIIGMGKSA